MQPEKGNHLTVVHCWRSSRKAALKVRLADLPQACPLPPRSDRPYARRGSRRCSQGAATLGRRPGVLLSLEHVV